MGQRFAIRLHMIVLALTRIAALAWIPVAAYSAISAIYALSLFDNVVSNSYIDTGSRIYTVLVFAINLAVVFFLVRHGSKVADWIVPAARQRCPACGCPITAASPERCTECALNFET